MAFKMKGSPYAMGTHKTKNTALYARRKHEEAKAGDDIPSKYEPAQPRFGPGGRQKKEEVRRPSTPKAHVGEVQQVGKDTALPQKKKTTRELGKTTTTYTKKSNIYDKDKFAKSKGSEGSIGWSKKYSYEPGGGRSGEGVTAEKVTKGGDKKVQYKDQGKTKVITKKGEAPKVKTKKSGKQYSKAISKIKKKSGHTERHR